MINRHLKIFLAEDDDDDKELFHEALNSIRPDMELITVNNGEEAVQFFKENSDLPDFVFLDINMPKKNGIECLKLIKSLHPNENFHIIMLSTSSARFVVDQSFQYGANLYIQKPHRFKDLVRYLDYCFTHLKTTAAKEDFLLNTWLEHNVR